MNVELWRRVPGVNGGKCFERYFLLDTGFVVVHCGHSTALCPYYVVAPDGSTILAPNGRGFRFLRDAKWAAICAADAARFKKSP